MLVCPIAANAPSSIEAIDTITTRSCHAPTRWPNDVAHHPQQQRHRGDLGRGGEEHRHRRRRALIHVGRPHVERHGGDLERQPDQHEHDADHQAGRRAFRLQQQFVQRRRSPSCRRSRTPAKCHTAAGRRPGRSGRNTSGRLPRTADRRGRTPPARRAPAIAVPAPDTASSGWTPPAMIIMPTVENSISTGNSNRAMPCVAVPVERQDRRRAPRRRG